MRKIVAVIAMVLALAACSPVLNRDLMKQGSREVPFEQLRQAPEAYKGRLFILGGLIVDDRLTEKGSQIEAVAVPVNSLGYLEQGDRSPGRFFAVYPREQGILDPMIFKKGREITLAGEFVEARKGRIEEMEYVYPVFAIRQIYLWDERNYYPYYPYYDPFYPRPMYPYDPWGRPYPYP